MNQTVQEIKKDLKRNPLLDLPLRKAQITEQVKVTPELAQHWLTFNVSNRALVRARLEQYRTDMVEGNWIYQGDPIRFACGKLLDGQTRLNALVLAGCTLPMLVMCGLDPRTQSNMDTGRSRSAQDSVSIEGLSSWDARCVSGAIHMIINHEQGTGIYAPTKYLNREVREYYLGHREPLDVSLQAVKTFPRTKPLVPHSRALALHYLMSKVDAVQTDLFFERLMAGDGLSKTSAVFHLRQRLLADRASDKKEPRPVYQQCAFIIRAWIKHRKETPVTSQAFLRYAGESFPEIV